MQPHRSMSPPADAGKTRGVLQVDRAVIASDCAHKTFEIPFASFLFLCTESPSCGSRNSRMVSNCHPSSSSLTFAGSPFTSLSGMPATSPSRSRRRGMGGVSGTKISAACRRKRVQQKRESLSQRHQREPFLSKLVKSEVKYVDRQTCDVHVSRSASLESLVGDKWRCEWQLQCDLSVYTVKIQLWLHTQAGERITFQIREIEIHFSCFRESEWDCLSDPRLVCE